MVHGTGGMKLLLQLTVLCVLTASATTILSTSQGRVVFLSDSGSLVFELFEVEGVATVELGGNTPPSYFFDCNTTGSDSSGLVWSRQSGALNSAFTIERTTRRVRLNTVGFSYSDLDVYLCTDTNAAGPPSVSLNITASNPAICPVELIYSTSEGLAVQLEIYVAGYPQIRGDQITWYRPDMTEILDSDASVQFANIRKTLILSNVHPSDSGTYLAEVAIPIIGTFFSRARTSIDLVVFVIDCGSPANPVNGQVDTPSGTTFTSTATYTCNMGYIMTGSLSRTCGSDGVWSPAAPTCDIDCGPLGNPVNGQVDMSSGTTYMNTATYTCNAGYNLIGTTSRTCGSDGVWSPAAPTCEPPTINVSITLPTEPPAFGRSYSLICTVTGADPSLNVNITYQWFKADPTSSGMVTRVGTDSSRLHLESLSFSDVGLYTCMTTVSSSLLSEDIESKSETFELKFPALFIQLQLTNIPSCKEYSVSNSRQKIEDIENAMAQNVARLCRCEFNSTLRLLSNSHLQCFDESPQIVTFRSQLSETSQTSTVELVSYIELWISDSEGVAVDGVFLGFQTTCALVINSLDAVECPGGSTDANDNLGGIVGGVMAAVLLFILVGVAIVTLIVFIKKQRTTQRSQAGNMREIELQDAGYPASSPSQIPTYEVVDTSGSVEYEEINQFQVIEENPVMIIEPHPPKRDYEYTQCPAYAPTHITVPPQN